MVPMCLMRNDWFYSLIGICVVIDVIQAAFHVPANVSWTLDLGDCGTNKGCWFMPGACYMETDASYSNCASIFTWRVEQQVAGKRNLVFEYDARIDDIENKYLGKYMAVGFSTDHKMGDDFVIECVANPAGHLQAYLSFNDLTTNIRSKRASELLLSNTRGSFRDDRFMCQTTYAVDEALFAGIPDDEKWKIVDITAQPYYFLFAKGDASLDSQVNFLRREPSNVSADSLLMHSLQDGNLFPWIATEIINITEDTKKLTSAKHYDIPRSVQHQLCQSHGILMIFGWWVFAATAIFLARYFKPAWEDSKFCGQPVWFQLHRLLMIISLILQCSGFALIFVQAGTIRTCSHTCGYEDYALMLHTYLGITAMAAALIQPLLALYRPNPAAKVCTILNWLHWFFGTGGFLIATVSIYLSAILGKTGLRRVHGYKPDYIMAGYLVAFVVCSLSLEMVWYCHLRSETLGHVQLTYTDPRRTSICWSKNSGLAQPSFSISQTLLLIFFIVAAMSLCSALSYLIMSANEL